MYTIFEELLKEKGLKLKDVSVATGIGLSTLTDWRAGRYTPKIDKIEKIASFLGVTVEYLQNGVNTEKESDTGKKYYFSDETAEAAQKMFENKELRALFDVQNDMDAEDLKALYNMALALKRKERGSND